MCIPVAEIFHALCLPLEGSKSLLSRRVLVGDYIIWLLLGLLDAIKLACFMEDGWLESSLCSTSLLHSTNPETSRASVFLFLY